MPAIQQRRGTAAELASANETPLEGQIYFESDTNRFKVGNVDSSGNLIPYNSLPYLDAKAISDIAGLQAALDEKSANLQEQINILKGDAGEALDTLGELSDAINDDPAFFQTQATLLGGKVDNTDARLTDSREWAADTVTQAEAEAGTDTDRKAWTVQRVWQAISSWWNSITLNSVSDVAASSPSYGDILRYHGSVNGWVNGRVDYSELTNVPASFTPDMTNVGIFDLNNVALQSGAQTSILPGEVIRSTGGNQWTHDMVTYGELYAGSAPMTGWPSGSLGDTIAKKADLVNGLVPASQLPSFVDDVLEYNGTSNFPATGETGKIYVDTSADETYRWTGTQYTQITASPGTTDDVPEGVNNLYFTNARAVNAIGAVHLGDLADVTIYANVAHGQVVAFDSVTNEFSEFDTGLTTLGPAPTGGWTAGTVGKAIDDKYDKAGGHVNGDVVFRRDGTGKDKISFENTYGSTGFSASETDLDYIRLYTSGTTYAGMGITTSNFNIGTTGLINVKIHANSNLMVQYATSNITRHYCDQFFNTECYFKPGGSATAPTISVEGDQTTGIYFPTTGNIGLTTNGVERLRISNSGYVGIGTAPNSSYTLDIGGDTNITGTLSATDLSVGAITTNGVFTTSNAILCAAGSATATAISKSGDRDTGIHFPAANEIAVSTYGQNRLHINSTGLVDIPGITGVLQVGGSPWGAGSEQFRVAGNSKLKTAYFYNNKYMTSGSTYVYGLDVYTEGTVYSGTTNGTVVGSQFQGIVDGSDASALNVVSVRGGCHNMTGTLDSAAGVKVDFTWYTSSTGTVGKVAKFWATSSQLCANATDRYGFLSEDVQDKNLFKGITYIGTDNDPSFLSSSSYKLNIDGGLQTLGTAYFHAGIIVPQGSFHLNYLHQTGASVNDLVLWNGSQWTAAPMPTHTHPQSQITGLVSDLAAKADLVNGTVPASQLPSFVDDVLEYNGTGNFPSTGETGKLYVDTSTNETYRWSGTQYVLITSSPGSTDAVPEGSTNLYHTSARAIAAAQTNIGTTAGTFCEGDDARLSDARTPVSHTHEVIELVQTTGYAAPKQWDCVGWSGSQFATFNPVSGRSIAEMLDVGPAAGSWGTLTVGDLLTWTGSKWDAVTPTSGGSTLASLTDTSVGNATQGRYLRYYNGVWVPATLEFNMRDAQDSSQSNQGQAASDGAIWVFNHAGQYWNGNDNLETHVSNRVDLNDIRDVSTAAPSSGDLLAWNGAQWAPTSPSGGGVTLTSLSDTTIASSLANGTLLAYDSTNADWRDRGIGSFQEISDSSRFQATLQGGGLVTVTPSGSDRYIKWSSSLRVMGAKSWPGIPTFYSNSTDGLWNINCPTSGTVPTEASQYLNGTRAVTADGIPLKNWECLWYALPLNGASTSNQNRFVITHYSSQRIGNLLDRGYVLIAARNGDAPSMGVKWMPSQVTIPDYGGTWDTYNQASSWAADLQNEIATTSTNRAIACDLRVGKVFAADMQTTGLHAITLSNVPSTNNYNKVSQYITIVLNWPVTTTAGTACTSTVSWPSSVKWPGGSAPALTNKQGRTDVFTLLSVDGGSSWLGFVGGQDFQ